jgi:hypothetical protein
MKKKLSLRSFLFPISIFSLTAITFLYVISYNAIYTQLSEQVDQILLNRASVAREVFDRTVHNISKEIELLTISSLQTDRLNDDIQVHLWETLRRARFIRNIGFISQNTRAVAIQNDPNMSQFLTTPFLPTNNRLNPFITNYNFYIENGFLDQFDIDVFLPVYVEIYHRNQLQSITRVHISTYSFLDEIITSGQGELKINNFTIDLSIFDSNHQLIQTSKNRTIQRYTPFATELSNLSPLFYNRTFAIREDGFNRLYFVADIDQRVVTEVANRAASLIILLGSITILFLFALFLLVQRQFARIQKLEASEMVAKYEALQTKMNPHFLFNSLNQIVGFAEEKKSKELLSSLRSLTFMLHMTIRNRKDFISLNEELSVVDHYIKLQRIHHKDNFTFHLSIEQSLNHYMILKFCLQPIIENCFIHGFGSEQTDFQIAMTITSSENSLIVEVIDNGKGLTSPEIESMNHLLQQETQLSKEHVGILSIHQRIRLLAGKDFGVEILPNNPGFHILVPLPKSTTPWI